MKHALEPPYAGRDPGDMMGLVVAQPQHVAAALGAVAAQRWEPPVRDPDALVIAGMGGSAIAAGLTAAAFGAALPRPVAVVRGYQLPPWVGPRSLVVLSSYSGNTEETLAIEEQARARGVPRMALSSGGELSARAGRDGSPLHVVPAGMPPRAALFHGWVPQTLLLHRLGWIPDPVPAWRETLRCLERGIERSGPQVPERKNPMKQLARKSAGRRLYVYSASGPMAAVGLRWRQQLNENAKLHVVQAVAPELSHNEIVAWQARPATRGRSLVYSLRDGDDHPREQQRMNHMEQLIRGAGTPVECFETAAADLLTRMALAVQAGDLLSVYLALAQDVDPTDIRSIEALKLWLASQPPS